MANVTLSKIDLSNPHDPNTKDFFAAMTRAAEQEVILMIEVIQGLKERLREERREEAELQASQEQKAEADRASFNSQVQATNEKTAQEAAKANPNTLALNELYKQVSGEIAALEAEKTNLEAKINDLKGTLIPKATHQVSDDLHKRREKLNDDIVKEVGEKDVSITDVQGNQMSKKEVADKLSTASRIGKLEDKLKSESFKESFISLLKQDQNGEVLKQVASKDNLINQINLFGKLGGEDITPKEMLYLIQRNKVLNDVIGKLSQANLNADIKDLQKLATLYQDLEKSEKSLDNTKDKIDVLKGQLKEMNELLTHIEQKSEAKAESKAQETPTFTKDK